MSETLPLPHTRTRIRLSLTSSADQGRGENQPCLSFLSLSLSVAVAAERFVSRAAVTGKTLRGEGPPLRAAHGLPLDGGRVRSHARTYFTAHPCTRTRYTASLGIWPPSVGCGWRPCTLPLQPHTRERERVREMIQREKREERDRKRGESEGERARARERGVGAPSSTSLSSAPSPSPSPAPAALPTRKPHMTSFKEGAREGKTSPAARRHGHCTD